MSGLVTRAGDVVGRDALQQWGRRGLIAFAPRITFEVCRGRPSCDIGTNLQLRNKISRTRAIQFCASSFHQEPNSTMKNLIVYYDEQKQLSTKIEEVPKPSDLEAHQVLIQVAAAGSNPKDYKHPLPEYFNIKVNQGDDCAG